MMTNPRPESQPSPTAEQLPALPATLPTALEMVRRLDRFVIGQDRAKEDLASAVYGHYLGLAYRFVHPEERHPFGQRHVLMLGPTGVGKTAMVTALARELGVPVAFASASMLVENGYVGLKIDSVFHTLLARSGWNPQLAERGIVYLDEVDKIRARAEAGSRDVGGLGVQTTLLSLLDGSPVQIERRSKGEYVEFDPSRVLFVVTGAFLGLTELVRERLATVLGSHARSLSDNELLDQVAPEDLVRFGFLPEFVGRFGVTTALHSLGASELVRILRDGEDTTLRRQQRFFQMHGIELVLSLDALDEIAALALVSGTGARALDARTQSVLAPVAFALPELAARGIDRVTITAACVRGEAEPLCEHVGHLPAGEPSATAMRQWVAELLSDAAKPPAVAPDLPDVAARRRLDELKRERLQLATAMELVRKWWQTFERDTSLSVVLATAEALAVRGVTVTEIFETMRVTGVANIQKNLDHIDWHGVPGRSGSSPLPLRPPRRMVSVRPEGVGSREARSGDQRSPSGRG